MEVNPSTGGRRKQMTSRNPRISSRRRAWLRGLYCLAHTVQHLHLSPLYLSSAERGRRKRSGPTIRMIRDTEIPISPIRVPVGDWLQAASRDSLSAEVSFMLAAQMAACFGLRTAATPGRRSRMVCLRYPLVICVLLQMEHYGWQQEKQIQAHRLMLDRVCTG